MKRSMVITNNRAFISFDKGPLSKRQRRTSKPTTRRYQSQEGKKRFAGTSRLKHSQKLGSFSPCSSGRCEVLQMP